MFPAEYFRRQDESDDARFYTTARKVVHIDDSAIRALTEQLAALLPPGGVYLDLMSSWRSHLPDSLRPARVVGLGMNSEEMQDNPQLDSHVVQNLNQQPALPFDDAMFDAAICTVSVQYLTQPVTVFAEVSRVLKPGGIFVVSFSNRCFPTKAIAAWRSMSDAQHIALVARYFELAGGYTDIKAWQKPGGLFRGDPLFIVHARRVSADA